MVAYLKAPEALVKLDEVDSLIFMGFGSFSSFGSIFAQMSEVSSAKYASIPQIAAGSPSDLDEAIQSFGSLFGYLFGGGDSKAIDEATRLVGLVANSGETDFLNVLSQPTTTPRGQLEMLANAADYLLGALILYWSQSYHKPIVTTTFTEVASHLNLKRGLYYSYPTPQRAARVLAKLVQYKEYLEREG
jgi:hypothetical protein